jgi:hypothetical protein
MFPGSLINFLSNEDTPLLAAGFFIGKFPNRARVLVVIAI